MQHHDRLAHPEEQVWQDVRADQVAVDPRPGLLLIPAAAGRWPEGRDPAVQARVRRKVQWHQASVPTTYVKIHT